MLPMGAFVAWAACVAAGAVTQHRGLHLQPGLLTAEECSVLIRQAEPLMEESQTIGDDGTRVSSSTWLPWINTSAQRRIDDKISALAGGLPASRAEAYQITRYTEGQMYMLHVDDDPADPPPAPEVPAIGRIGTVLVFLSDVAAGGETLFTHRSADYSRDGGSSAASRAAFLKMCSSNKSHGDSRSTGPTRVVPRAGTGVFWRTFAQREGVGNSLRFLANTTHGSCPVGRRGGP